MKYIYMVIQLFLTYEIYLMYVADDVKGLAFFMVLLILSAFYPKVMNIESLLEELVCHKRMEIKHSAEYIKNLGLEKDIEELINKIENKIDQKDKK